MSYRLLIEPICIQCISGNPFREGLWRVDGENVSLEFQIWQEKQVVISSRQEDNWVWNPNLLGRQSIGIDCNVLGSEWGNLDSHREKKNRAPEKPAFKGRGQEAPSKEAVEGPLWNPRPKGERHVIREQVPSVPHQEIKEEKAAECPGFGNKDLCVLGEHSSGRWGRRLQWVEEEWRGGEWGQTFKNLGQKRERTTARWRCGVLRGMCWKAETQTSYMSRGRGDRSRRGQSL